MPAAPVRVVFLLLKYLNAQLPIGWNVPLRRVAGQARSRMTSPSKVLLVVDLWRNCGLQGRRRYRLLSGGGKAFL